MTALSVLSLVAFVAHLSIGIYSFLSDKRSAQNVSYSIASFALAAMAFSFFFIYKSSISLEEYRFWYILSTTGWTIGIAAFALFSLNLTGVSKKFRNYLSMPILYGIAAALMVFAMVILSRSPIEKHLNIISLMYRLSPAYFVVYLVFQAFCVLFLSLFLILRWGINSKNVRDRWEAFTIVVSLTLFIALTYVWDYFDIVYGFGILSITPVFSLIWSGGILFAIKRYRIFSISPSYIADQIVANMSDLMIVTDNNLNIIRINSRVSSTLEYLPAEIVGRPVASFMANPEGTKNFLTESLKNCGYGKFSMDAELKTKSGNPVPVRFAVIEVTDRKKMKIGVALIGYDMRIFQDMQMTNIRIAQALNYVEKSSDDLQRFIYSVSVALKEPLRMIGSFSNLVNHKLDSDPDDVDSIREMQTYVIDGVSRMNDLVNGLMEYSRIESHTGPLEIVNLNEPLDSALYRLKQEIKELDAKITRDKLPNVMSDPMQMENLFFHLLRNALSYRDPDRSPVIHVGHEDSDKYHVLFVSDNGIGIAPEFHNEIFELFRRLTTFQEVPGSGVGLAICKKIVELHGGNIWVESETGNGAKFYFTLKAAE